MIKDAFSEPYYCPKCGVFRKMEYYQTGKVICPFCGNVYDINRDLMRQWWADEIYYRIFGEPLGIN